MANIGMSLTNLQKELTKIKKYYKNHPVPSHAPTSTPSPAPTPAPTKAPSVRGGVYHAQKEDGSRTSKARAGRHYNLQPLDVQAFGGRYNPIRRVGLRRLKDDATKKKTNTKKRIRNKKKK